jgi:hypothetical protein
MARPEINTLNVPTAVGVGQASNVFRFRDKTVQVNGPFVATLQIEGSVDGSNFVAIGTPLTAPGLLSVPFAVQFVRVRVTAFTSGTPTAVASGFDYRAL